MSPTSALASLRGARTPRINTHPPYASTFGPEVVELCASAGLILDDPWQVEAVDVMCAIRPTGKWVCFEYAEIVSRQNGKGSIGEARVLGGLFLFDEKLIMWSSNRYNSSREAFRRVLGLIESSDDMTRRVKRVNRTHGEEGIELYGPRQNRITGVQRLTFVARSEQAGRGFTAGCLIIDEALSYTHGQAGALLPTMSAVPNPQIVYLSSPPLATDPDLVLFQLKDRGEKGDDPALGWRDWGIKKTLNELETVNLDDRAIWAATNPAFGSRISEEHISRERNSMEAATFARERLGSWPPSPVDKNDQGAIPASRWAALADEDSEPGPDVALAVDVEPNRGHSTIASFSVRPDGKGHVEVIAYAAGTAWVVPALVKLRQLHDPVAVVLDSRGPASSLIAPLIAAGITTPEKSSEPKRGDLLLMRTNDVAEAWGAFLDACEEDADAIRHIEQVQLTGAVANAKTRPLGDAQALARRTAAGDISPLVAVVSARWGYFDRISRITGNDDFEPGVWVL